jgi:dethiobiotin synthetase
MATGYVIAGTDTGVGKTFIACALLHRLREAGVTAVGMKPVAAGCERTVEGLINQDVEALRWASAVTLPREAINVYAFERPIAPHIAAALDGTHIDLDAIVRRFDQLSSTADVVVVEGVGGWLVPLNDSESFADLAAKLRLPVILVVGMRLGCLNHALLTAEAIRTRGLALVGWVANHIDADMACPEENVRSLEHRLQCPLLGVVPYQRFPAPARVVLDLPGGCDMPTRTSTR